MAIWNWSSFLALCKVHVNGKKVRGRSERESGELGENEREVVRGEMVWELDS